MKACICTHAQHHDCPLNEQLRPLYKLKFGLVSRIVRHEKLTLDGDEDSACLGCGASHTCRCNKAGLLGCGIDLFSAAWDDSVRFRAALTLDQAIDHLLAKGVAQNRVQENFVANGLPHVDTIFELLIQNLGEAWTATYIGDATAAADRDRIETRVLDRMRTVLNKTRATEQNSLLKGIHTLWKGSRHPRFFRGQRVMAKVLSQNSARFNPDYKGQEFAARIIGAGVIPNTYEVIYDARLEDGSQDRHTRVFPFLDGTAPSRDFRLGKALGGGQRVLREPTNDFAWDSGLE